jgi:hypothetical protein
MKINDLVDLRLRPAGAELRVVITARPTLHLNLPHRARARVWPRKVLRRVALSID